MTAFDFRTAWTKWSLSASKRPSTFWLLVILLLPSSEAWVCIHLKRSIHIHIHQTYVICELIIVWSREILLLLPFLFTWPLLRRPRGLAASSSLYGNVRDVKPFLVLPASRRIVLPTSWSSLLSCKIEFHLFALYCPRRSYIYLAFGRGSWVPARTGTYGHISKMAFSTARIKNALLFVLRSPLLIETRKKGWERLTWVLSIQEIIQVRFGSHAMPFLVSKRDFVAASFCFLDLTIGLLRKLTDRPLAWPPYFFKADLTHIFFLLLSQNQDLIFCERVMAMLHKDAQEKLQQERRTGDQMAG